MSEQSVTVGLIGIPSIEERRLQAAFIHSKTRTTSYKALMLSEEPDVLMVNADEPSSLIKWRVYRDKLAAEQKPEPPSILVSKDREFKTHHYQVRRPLIASRVISVLDTVAANELKVVEDIAIEISGLLGETAPPTPSTNEAQTVTNKTPKAELCEECRALVVDDSLPVRIQMDQALKKHVANVDFAETGEEAFDYLKKNHYDIIFLDIVLPGVDGYEVCKVIKQGDAKDTPVIMLTGNTSASDKIKGKLAGCDTYLIKPISQTIFNEVVQQYLNKTTLNSSQLSI